MLNGKSISYSIFIKFDGLEYKRLPILKIPLLTQFSTLDKVFYICQIKELELFLTLECALITIQMFCKSCVKDLISLAEPLLLQREYSPVVQITSSVNFFVRGCGEIQSTDISPLFTFLDLLSLFLLLSSSRLSYILIRKRTCLTRNKN